MPNSAPPFVEVYLAANPTQAHLLRILLEQDGIPARVVGDLLQSVAGEIPFGAASAPSVWVSEDDERRAREIIRQWEADQRSRPQNVAPESWNCPECDAVVAGNDAICAVCGCRLDDAAGDSTESVLSDTVEDSDWTPLVTNWRLGGVVAVMLLVLAVAFVWWIRWGEPSDARGYYARGVRHYEAGRYDAAEDDFEQSIRLWSSAGAYSYIARCRFAEGDYESAILELTRAIEMDPTDTTDFVVRGECQYRLGRYEQARTDFESAIRRAPNEPWGYSALAWMLSGCPDAEVRDGEQAVIHSRTACELTDWGDSGMLSTFAAACAESGRIDEAMKWQREAIVRASDEDRESFQDALDLYEHGEPFRDPAPEDW